MDEEFVSSRAVLGELKDLFSRGWWILALGGLVGAVVAAGWSLSERPVYRSVATLYVTSSLDGASASAAYQGSMASQQRVLSYSRLVSSDAVVRSALAESGLSMTLDTALTSLSASGAPNTVLLNISATSTDQTTAMRLANGAAVAMEKYVRVLETPSGGGEPLAKLTVVTPAQLSVNPVSPRTGRNVAVGLGGGVFVGIGVLILRQRLDLKLRSQEDLDEISSLPVLGTLPDDTGLSGHSVIDFGAGANPVAEALRRVRTNLEFVSVDRPLRTLLVTSPAAGEGKTTTSVNLASAFAEMGRRVLIVDADLRRGSIGELFSVNSRVGISDVLLGRLSIHDAIQESDIPGLFVLSRGSDVPNPVELLSSQRASDMFSQASGLCDIMLIDSPPLLVLSDSAVLSTYADGVVLVVRGNQSKKPEIVSSIAELGRAHSAIVGVIFNGAPVSVGAYGSEYGARAGDSLDSADAVKS
ncbi:polysaccharide biosynthesis tyrosine autokinase [Gordonia sp. NPDC003424]